MALERGMSYSITAKIINMAAINTMAMARQRATCGGFLVTHRNPFTCSRIRGIFCASGDLPFFRWRVYGAREASQGSPLRSDRYAARTKRAALTNLPLRSVCFQLGKNVIEKWEQLRPDTIPCAFGATKAQSRKAGGVR